MRYNQKKETQEKDAFIVFTWKEKKMLPFAKSKEKTSFDL